MLVVKAAGRGGSMSRFTGRRFQGIDLEDEVTVNGRSVKVITGFGRFVEDGNWFFDLFRFNKAVRKTWAAETLETLQSEYNPAVEQYKSWVIQGRLNYQKALDSLRIQSEAVDASYKRLVNEFKAVQRQQDFDKVKKAQINGYLLHGDGSSDAPAIAADVQNAPPIYGLRTDARVLLSSAKATIEHAKILRQKRELLDESIKQLTAQGAEAFAKSTHGAKVQISDPYLNVYAASRQIHPEYQHEFNQHHKLDHEAVAYGMGLLDRVSDTILGNEQEFVDNQWFFPATSLTREFKREYGAYLAEKKDEVKKEKQALAESAFNRVIGNGKGDGLTEDLVGRYKKFIDKNGDFSVHLIERQDLPRVIENLTARLERIGQDRDRKRGYPLTLLLKRLQAHQQDLFARVEEAIDLAKRDKGSLLAGLWVAYNTERAPYIPSNIPDVQSTTRDFSCLFGDDTLEARIRFKHTIEHSKEYQQSKGDDRGFLDNIITHLSNNDSRLFVIDSLMRPELLDNLWTENARRSVPLKDLLINSQSLESFRVYLGKELAATEEALKTVKSHWFRSIFDFFPFVTNRQKPLQKSIHDLKLLLKEVEFSQKQSPEQRNAKYIKVVADHKSITRFVNDSNSIKSDGPRLYSARLVFLLDDARLGQNKRFFVDFYKEYKAFFGRKISTGMHVPDKIIAKIKASYDLDNAHHRRYFFDLVREMNELQPTFFDDFLSDEHAARAISTKAANGSHDQFVNYYDELGRLVKNDAPTLRKQAEWARDDLEDEFFSLIAHSGVTSENIDRFKKTIELIEYNNTGNPEKLKLIQFYKKIINGDPFDDLFFNIDKANVPADLSALGSGDFSAKLARNGGTQNIMQVLVEKFTKVKLDELKRKGALAVDFEGDKGKGAELTTYRRLLGTYGKAGWGYYNRVEMLAKTATVPAIFDKNTCLLQLQKRAGAEAEVVAYWMTATNKRRSKSIALTKLHGVSLPHQGQATNDPTVAGEIIRLYGCDRITDDYQDIGPATRATKAFLELLFVSPENIPDQDINDFIDIGDLEDSKRSCQILVEQLDARLGVKLGSRKHLNDLPPEDIMRQNLSLCFTSGYKEKLVLLTDAYVSALQKAVVFAPNRVDANNLLKKYALLFNVIFSATQKSAVATTYFNKLFGNNVEVTLEGNDKELHNYYQLDRNSMQQAVADVIDKYIRAFPKQKLSDTLYETILVYNDDFWWHEATARTILQVGSNDNIAVYTAQRIREIFAIDASNPGKALQFAKDLCSLLDSKGFDGSAKIRDSSEISELLLGELEKQWTEASDYLCSTILKSDQSKVVLQNSRISKISLLLKGAADEETHIESGHFIRFIDSSSDQGINFADRLIPEDNKKSAAKLTYLFDHFIGYTLAPQGVVAFVNDPSHVTERRELSTFKNSATIDKAVYKRQLDMAINLAEKFDASKKCLDTIILHDLNRVLLGHQTAAAFILLADSNNYLHRENDAKRNAAAWANLEFFLKSCLLFVPTSRSLHFDNFRRYDDIRVMDNKIGLGAVIYHYLGVSPSDLQLECADIYTISYVSYLINQSANFDSIKRLLDDLEASYPYFKSINNRRESARVLNEMLLSQFHYPNNESYQPGLYAFTEVKWAVALRYGDPHTKKIAVLAKIAAIFDLAASLDPSAPESELRIRDEITAFKSFCQTEELGILKLKSYIGQETQEEAYLRSMFDYYIDEQSFPGYSPLITLLTDKLIEEDYVDFGSQHNREGEKSWLHLCRLKHLKHYYANALDLDTQRTIELEQQGMTKEQLEQVDPQKSYLEFQQAQVSLKDGLSTSGGTHTLANSWGYFGAQNVKKGSNPSLARYGLESVEETLSHYIDGIQDTHAEPNKMSEYSVFYHFRLTLILAVQDSFTYPDYFRNKWEQCSKNFKHSAMIASIKNEFFTQLTAGELDRAKESYDRLLLLAADEETANEKLTARKNLAKLASSWLLEFVRERVAATASDISGLQVYIAQILPRAAANHTDFLVKLAELNQYIQGLSEYAPLSFGLRSVLGRIDNQRGYNHVYMMNAGERPPMRLTKNNILYLSETKDEAGKRITLSGYYANAQGKIEQKVLSGPRISSFEHNIRLPKPGEWFKDEQEVEPIASRFGMRRQKITDNEFILTKEFEHKFKKSEANAVSERFSFYSKSLPSKLDIPTSFFDYLVSKLFTNTSTLTRDSLKKIFVPLIDGDNADYRKELEFVIDSLTSRADIVLIEALDNEMKKESREADDQRRYLNQFYQTVLKPRAESLRFSKLMDSIGSQGSIFAFLHELTHKPGVFFTEEDLEFYSSAVIDQQIAEVLRGITKKATHIRSLHDFYQNILVGKKEECETRLLALRNRHEHLVMRLVQDNSDYQASKQELERQYNEKKAEIEREIVAVDAINTQNISPAQQLTLLSHFSQLLIEKLAAGVLSDQDFLKQRVRMIQRHIASLSALDERQVITASLHEIKDASCMSALLKDSAKKVNILIDHMDKINELYQQLINDVTTSNGQMNFSITHNEDYLLVVEFDARRKNGLTSKEGIFASAIALARSSGNYRRLTHLEALRDFILSDGAPTELERLKKEEHHTREYEAQLAKIDLIIATLFSASCSSLNLDAFLQAVEHAKNLNANTAIFLPNEVLAKYPNISRVINFNKGFLTLDQSSAEEGGFESIVNDMHTCLLNDARSSSAVANLRHAISFDAKLEQMIRSNDDFVPMSDAELKLLTGKQRNLHETMCLMYALNSKALAEADYDIPEKEFTQLMSLLIKENSLSYLKLSIGDKYPAFISNQFGVLKGIIFNATAYQMHNDEGIEARDCEALLSKVKTLLIQSAQFLIMAGYYDSVDSELTISIDQQSVPLFFNTMLRETQQALKQFQIGRNLSVVKSMLTRAQEGIVRDQDDCSEFFTAYNFLKRHANPSGALDEANTILAVSIPQVLGESAPKIKEQIYDALVNDDGLSLTQTASRLRAAEDAVSISSSSKSGEKPKGGGIFSRYFSAHKSTAEDAASFSSVKELNTPTLFSRNSTTGRSGTSKSSIGSDEGSTPNRTVNSTFEASF